MKSEARKALVSRLMRGHLKDPLLPEALVSIWVAAGPEFQAHIDLTSENRSASLWQWWIAGGRSDFPGLRSEIDEFLFQKLHWEHYEAILQLLKNPSCPTTPSIADKMPPPAFTPSDLISPLGKSVYNIREELQVLFDQSETKGAAEFNCWILTHGIEEHFGASSYLSRLQALNLLRAISGVTEQGYVSNGVYDEFLFHCLPAARILLPYLSDAEFWECLAALHYDFIGQPGQNPGRPSPLMALIHRHRPDLQAEFDLDTAEGREGLWDWWRAHGVVEYIGNSEWIERKEARLLLGSLGAAADSLDHLRYEALQTLLLPEPTGLTADERAESDALFYATHFDHTAIPGQTSGQLSPLMALIHRHRPDLQVAFDLDTVEGREGFWNWWQSFGLTEYPIPSQENVSASTEMGWTGPDAADTISSSSPAVGAKQTLGAANAPSAKTICLVGYPRGEFGLGEDIRLVRTSLRTAGIEPEVVKAPWNIIARQTIDEQAEEADAADFNSDVMLYVMPAFDTLTLLNKVGPRAFNARRKIGYWQWELDRFPEPAKIAFDLIDEIWCHSEHSAKAFRSATEKPVTKVPLPVLVPEIRPVQRSNFGFYDGDYVVFSSFDGASSISRKNPMGAILAFQQAFPRKGWPRARLVVKAMNTIDDALWRDCLRKAALDDRIRIFNRVLDRNEYYELLQCCDVVLSLHRAEGFGRVMAEAMAIGIPAIATGYSGNLDFMSADNSWLVAGELSPLIPGDYPFHQGQEWLEPDVGEAAKALRECFENDEKRTRLVKNAKAMIGRYSPDNCGKIYAELLGQ